MRHESCARQGEGTISDQVLYSIVWKEGSLTSRTTRVTTTGSRNDMPSIVTASGQKRMVSWT